MRRTKLLRNGQKGQALALVLVLMLLGGLIVAPLLQFMGTGLKAGGVYESKMDELYAADAGISDGFWQIKQENLETLPGFETYSAYDYYTSNWTYTISSQSINDFGSAKPPVSVAIKNIFIPEFYVPGTVPTSDDAQSIIEGPPDPLLVIGGSAATVPQGATPGTYNIHVVLSDPAEVFHVQSIGIWLPPGFSYVVGSSNLESDPGTPPYRPIDTDIDPYRGGTAVVWSFSSLEFNDMPDFRPFGGTVESTISFDFNGQENAPAAVSWIVTDRTPDADMPLSYTWDGGKKVFQVTSTADDPDRPGQTIIDAYTVKVELQKMASAIEGDYYATGNTLMTNSVWDGGHVRETFVHTDVSIPINSSINAVPAESSPGSGDGVPIDANLVSAYLYWTSWVDENGLSISSNYPDDCSDFSLWTRNGLPDGDTGWLSPTSNSADSGGDGNGFESNALRAYANDALWAANNNGAGDRHRFWGYDTTAIPATNPIIGIEVRLDWWLDSTSQANSMSVELSWNGGSSWTAPKTASTERTSDGNPTDVVGNSADLWGHSWTLSELSSANFRVRVTSNSNSTSRDFRLDWVAVKVTYDDTYLWHTSGEFQGQGDTAALVSERTLEMTSGLDLSAFPSGSVIVSWDQCEEGTLESNDQLKFAFYGDSAWSHIDGEGFEAFHDDIGSGFVHFAYAVPDAYLKDDFRMRFFFDFDAEDEFVYIDNIRIFSKIDPSVFFKIDDQLVYLDDDGNPQEDLSGTEEIFFDTAQSITSGTGYSYACRKDVSDLVLEFAETDDGEPGEDGSEADDIYIPGIGSYTVGEVEGSFGDQLSHAGWSLVLVYSSPTTKGHYLYLFDEFTYALGEDDGNENNDSLDFDGDGLCGGTVSGFIVPDPLPGESANGNAAKMTVFVGEGDAWISGDNGISDFVAFNAPEDYWDSTPHPRDIPNSYKLWDGIDSTGNPEFTGSNANNLPGSPNQWYGGESNNVWNGQSTLFNADGVDVDTFHVPWSSGLMSPGQTSAHIDLFTDTDNWNLIYIIMSFRSKTNIGGTLSYLIRS